jgi:sarcosine oxidase
VLGLEQHDLVHNLGSHHGQARMIRQAYFEHPDYVPLLQRAYWHWDELEAQTRQRSLYRTGGLYIGEPNGTIVSGSRHAAEQHDLPHEILDHAALSQRFPAFQVPDTMVGFFEPDAGYLVPEIAVASHIQLAREYDADIREHQTVVDWSVETHGDASRAVIVRTADATFHARHLLITAGAWTADWLEQHPSPVDGKDFNLTVTQQIQAWFQPSQPEAFQNQPANFPCWFVETDSPFGHYGFPIPPDMGRSPSGRGGDTGGPPVASGQATHAPAAIKVALHKAGTVTDPECVDRRVSLEETEELADFLRVYLPDAVGPLVDSSVCLYTNSSDGHFIIDRHPEHAQVTIACGFSGHGFKFASVIGEALADLALTGSSDLPIDFLRARRHA